MIRLIRLLEKESEYISGEKISSELGITRSAVWKKIGSLRKKGYVIHAIPSRGYKLTQVPDLSEEYIRARVKSNLWQNILFYDSVDSTNELSLRLAATGNLRSGSVVIADTQGRGKGRLGRRWISPPGVNIYMSIILRPQMSPRDATLLTFLAAVACANALIAEAGMSVVIKWPNDLMVSEKKIGGILTEVRSDPDKITVAVVGIGINVNMPRIEFDEEIKDTATSISEETGTYHSRSRLVVRILHEFARWHETLETRGRHPLLQEWRRLSSTIGKNVHVSMRDNAITGVAEDIDEEGMLLVRLATGVLKKISTGDVTELR